MSPAAPIPSPTSTAPQPTCTTAVPDQYGHVPFDSCNSNYSYDPSFTAELAVAVIFGILTLIHLVLAILFKKKYCWVLIMGSAWETAAFVFRTVGSRRQQEQIFAIAGQLFFLLAPLWINAFAYMTVARMVYFGLPSRRIWGFPAIRMTVLFVWLDIVCFIVQAAGGSMLSGDDDNIKNIGMKIYTAGIALQLAFVLIFTVVTIGFYLEARKVHGNMGRLKWLTWTLLAVLILITIRVSFRVAEFAPGVNSSNILLTNEVFPFTLDALPMALALAILAIIHPGMVLTGPDGDFPKLSRAEKKELKRQKKERKQARKQSRRSSSDSGDIINLNVR